jgi:hypothetical protein
MTSLIAAAQFIAVLTAAVLGVICLVSTTSRPARRFRGARRLRRLGVTR